MPVFRVERNKGYTVMSNYHLRDKSLSLKAKGLLSQILRAYPQISNCGKIATKGGGKNGEKELQVMDNIRCVLGGRKG